MTIFKFRYIGLFLILTVLAVGCQNKKEGNKQTNQEQQKKKIQQARADSLHRVRQRRDSLRQARADSLAKIREAKQQKEKKKSERKMSLDLQGQGDYAVQVAAWRSKVKAKNRAQVWESRGFKNAYTVKYHGPSPGDVWFRVRLGYTNSLEKAHHIQKHIRKKYHAASWIAESS